MAKSRIFRRGIPTEVDVRSLFETFGVPVEGQPITYEAVERTIRVLRTSCRWRTVTWAWRQRLIREYDVYLGAWEEAFHRLVPTERVDLGGRYVRTIFRAGKKGQRVLSTTDRTRLTKEEQQRADHLHLITATIVQQGRRIARHTPPSLPGGVKQP